MVGCGHTDGAVVRARRHPAAYFVNRGQLSFGYLIRALESLAPFPSLGATTTAVSEACLSEAIHIRLLQTPSVAYCCVVRVGKSSITFATVIIPSTKCQICRQLERLRGKF